MKIQKKLCVVLLSTTFVLSGHFALAEQTRELTRSEKLIQIQKEADEISEQIKKAKNQMAFHKNLRNIEIVLTVSAAIGAGLLYKNSGGSGPGGFDNLVPRVAAVGLGAVTALSGVGIVYSSYKFKLTREQLLELETRSTAIQAKLKAKQAEIDNSKN
jgi:hypothetical protein